MSRIVITMDTEAKTLVCNIDGKVFDGPKHVQMWRHEFDDGDSWVGLEIVGATEDISDDVRKEVRITADKDGPVVIRDESAALEDAAFKLMGLHKSDKKKKKSGSIY